jgi:hypothetical protein
MNLPYPNIRRKRKPLLPVEPVPTVCPHCGRSSAEPVKPAAETPPVAPEKITTPDDAKIPATSESE